METGQRGVPVRSGPEAGRARRVPARGVRRRRGVAPGGGFAARRSRLGGHVHRRPGSPLRRRRHRGRRWGHRGRPASRPPPRALRGGGTAGGGRDGTRLSCPRSAPVARRCDQGRGQVFERARRVAAVRAGGAGRGRAHPSQHPRRPRRRQRRRRGLHRRGAAGGGNAARAPARRAARPEAVPGLRAADRGRPGGGARERDRPPRPEARKPVRDPGRPGQGPRLRPREASADDRVRRSAGHGLAHPAGSPARDRGLHGPRAGARPAGGRALGRFLLRLRALRDALRPSRVRRRLSGGGDERDPDPGATRHRGTPPLDRRDPATLPGEEAGGPLPLGAGPRRGPRRGRRSGRAIRSAGAAAARGRRALDRRPAFHGHEPGTGPGILLRGNGGGADQRAGQGRRPARRRPDLGLPVQGRKRESPPHRRGAGRGQGPGWKHPEGGHPAADHGPARERRRRLLPLVGALRARGAGHLCRPGRDRRPRGGGPAPQARSAPGAHPPLHR